MRFYTGRHAFYCGIDLHSKQMYLCIQDREGEVLVHKNMETDDTPFLDAVEPYMDDIVVCAECTFSWYWLADLCYEMDIPFVLGHALYMKAIHGGKSKNDRIDAYKIAALLRGGLIPYGFVYPGKIRPTRDLLRRRGHMVKLRSKLLAHIKMTNDQYNLPPLPGDPRRPTAREELSQHFSNLPLVQASIDTDLAVIETCDQQIRAIENTVMAQARKYRSSDLHLLRSIPGVGKILSMTILYEVCNIERFPSVKNFASYCRLVKGQDISAGKVKGSKGGKMGNVHLKWAFSEAVVCMLHKSADAKKYCKRKEKKYGKGKAMSVMAHKIGRAVYYMLSNQNPFDSQRFFAS